MKISHIPVLLDEVIEKMNINPNGIYVDATLGLGGHSRKILDFLENGKLIAFDQDEKAIEFSKNLIKNNKNIIFIKSNFVNLKKELEQIGITKIDGILYDLGTSYYQLTDETRGFSYHGKSKLDMRMNLSNDFSAIDLLNTYSEEMLSKILKEYGEEKKHRQIAKEIINYRNSSKIEYNQQLNEIIWKIKGHNKLKHPAKNIYQAIRIEVNNELTSIRDSLEQAFELLNVDGRILTISFHSLEDKIVKNVYWKYKNRIIENEFKNIHLFHTLKTIYPSKSEIEKNYASRSAKLRVIIKKYE